MGTKLAFSSAYQPQSDGQTEVVNRTIEMYLCCFTSNRPRRWVEWIPWAEYCSNTSFHSSLQATPFQLVYGRYPPRLLNYLGGSTRVEVVDHALDERNAVLQAARDRVLQAQQRMKFSYDANHREVSFEVGDWVWLKPHPYRQLTIAKRSSNKLSPKYFGLFKVLEKVGVVAYKLALPSESRIHDVFHVSLLKKFTGEAPGSITPLPSLHDGRIIPVPRTILRTRLNRGEQELLVHWEGSSEENATWEELTTLRDAYLELELADKLPLEEGSDVKDAFVGRVYSRKNKGKGDKIKMARCC